MPGPAGMVGEQMAAKASGINGMESPPRARGAAIGGRKDKLMTYITPACAGSSSS